MEISLFEHDELARRWASELILFKELDLFCGKSME